MEIAIIDDDLSFSKTLEKEISKFMMDLGISHNIDIINDDFFFNSKKKNYDLYFLDIDLQIINGIDIGKYLMNETNPIIIFVSSREDLVFSSLSVRPFYFVRKSNLQEDLKIMFVLLERYLKETMHLVHFEFQGRKIDLFLKDIYMIESQGHHMILYTKKGEYTCRSTMQEMLEKLGTEMIVQFQKSYAVNMNYIKEMNQGNMILKDGKDYNIGRKFKDNFLQKYKEYFLR